MIPNPIASKGWAKVNLKHCITEKQIPSGLASAPFTLSQDLWDLPLTLSNSK